LLKKQGRRNFVYISLFGANLNIEPTKEHFRHILLYYFRKGKNADQLAKNLRDLYGDNALKERQYRNCFTKFRSGDFSLEDEPRSGRPSEVDDDQIKALIDLDCHVTEREIVDKLNIPKFTVP